MEAACCCCRGAQRRVSRLCWHAQELDPCRWERVAAPAWRVFGAAAAGALRGTGGALCEDATAAHNSSALGAAQKRRWAQSAPRGLAAASSAHSAELPASRRTLKRSLSSMRRLVVPGGAVRCPGPFAPAPGLAREIWASKKLLRLIQEGMEERGHRMMYRCIRLRGSGGDIIFKVDGGAPIH